MIKFKNLGIGSQQFLSNSLFEGVNFFHFSREGGQNFSIALKRGL